VECNWKKVSRKETPKPEIGSNGNQGHDLQRDTAPDTCNCGAGMNEQKEGVEPGLASNWGEAQKVSEARGNVKKKGKWGAGTKVQVAGVVGNGDLPSLKRTKLSTKKGKTKSVNLKQEGRHIYGGGNILELRKSLVG